MKDPDIIILYVSVSVPAANKAVFEQHLIRIVNMARQAAGCLTYQWYPDPEDPAHYMIYGEFDSESNFALYRKSEVVQQIGKRLLPLLSGAPVFKHVRGRVFEQG